MSKKITPAYRQCLLKEKGYTQKRVALELDVSEMSVSDEVNDKARSHRIRCKIAEIVGMPVAEVFPDYYGRPPQRKTSKTANKPL